MPGHDLGGTVGRMTVASTADPLAEFFPRSFTRTAQVVPVEADAETTFRAVLETDLAGSPLVRALTLLRAVPDRMVRSVRRLPPQPPPARTLAELVDAGWWTVLRSDPPHALALGLVMWDDRVPREGQARSLFDAPAAGAVRVGWELRVEPVSDERSLLITETMTDPVDARAEHRFRRYWRLISPFAALTRRLVIKRIARAAGARPRATKVAA